MSVQSSTTLKRKHDSEDPISDETPSDGDTGVGNEAIPYDIF